MKISNYILPLFFCGTLSLQGCEDFLNTEPTESYSDDTVWGSPTTVDAFIIQSYGGAFDLYTDFESMDKLYTTNAIAVRNVCADEARGLKTREWDWGFNKFGIIRNCNLIIEKVSASTVLSDTYKKQAIAEAKMLRAMIYFDLARHCGRFIWVDHVMQQDESFELPLTASIEESYDYVLKDIREAVIDLPKTAASGRLTRNAGLALQSEICLTAAAYTGKTDLFKEAADAVDAIEGVSLDTDYGSIFNEKGAYSSPEIILARYYSSETTTCSSIQMVRMQPNMPNTMMDKTGCGPHWKTDLVFEGWMFFAPSQNLIDDYLAIDQTTGKAVRWNESSQFKNSTRTLTLPEVNSLIPPRDPAELVEGKTLAYTTTEGSIISDLMYQNRDKRFEASILYDGCSYYNETLLMCQKGNLNRAATTNYANDHVPLSNYAWRKAMYNVTPRIFFNVYTDYHYVIFRYGRALLNKAEALLCMAKSDPSKLAEAVATLNQTRTIHGGLPASTASTLEEAWKDYKRERHIDLVMEGDYYWSLLRWGKYGYEANDNRAPGGVIEELNTPATFPEISADRKAIYIGNIQFQNDRREFKNERGYLFPIPQGQINANNALSDKDQNPGW